MNHITLDTLKNKHKNKEKITALTAYDASFASIINMEEIDVVLVGDSLGMVVQGNTDTICVNINNIVYHAQAVNSVLDYSLLMVDMPFMSATSAKQAIKNAKKLMQQTGAAVIKLETANNQHDIIKTLSENGVPICAHLGLRPQFIHKIGGYKYQGVGREYEDDMLKNADLMQQAGADMLVAECIPAHLAAKITQNSSVPVIGIGAGGNTSGQILVLYDILGISKNKPRFAKDYLKNNTSIQQAIRSYKKEVIEQKFPAPEHILY
jgi:3-methyl-2-oxobutanoate hydroxymethyltransferase